MLQSYHHTNVLMTECCEWAIQAHQKLKPQLAADKLHNHDTQNNGMEDTKNV